MTRGEYSVTAIITTHNRRTFLERAVNSVFSQDYDDLDLIVVDDASTDDTKEYMTALAEADERVTYIRIAPEDSKGANHARNTGAAAAEGEFIAFLDDDDEWLPYKTKMQTAFFRRYPEAAAVSADWIDVYKFRNKQYEISTKHRFKREKNGFFATSYMSITSTYMIRREAFEKVGGFDETLTDIHEIELSYRLCMNYSVGYIKKPVYKYYHYYDGKSISANPDNYLKALDMVKAKYSKELSELTEEQKEKRRLTEAIDISDRFLIAGNNRMFRRTIRPVLGKLSKWKRIKYILSYFCGIKPITMVYILLKKTEQKIKGD